MGFHKPLVTLDEVCEISGEMWSDSNMSLTLQQHHQALERKEKMALKCCCVQGWMCTGCSVVMRKLLLLFSNYMHSYPAGQIENNEKITGNCACITGSLLSPFDLIFSLSVFLSLCFSSALTYLWLIFVIVPPVSGAFVLPYISTCSNYLKPFIWERSYWLMTSHFKGSTTMTLAWSV